jgi:hypothetical protein
MIDTLILIVKEKEKHDKEPIFSPLPVVVK